MKYSVRPIEQCPTKQVEGETDGYNYVSDSKGACFFKACSMRPGIQTIVYLNTNKLLYANTIIPEKLISRVFFIAIELETTENFLIHLPYEAHIINFHTPYMVWEKRIVSLLVYSPTGKEPDVSSFSDSTQNLLIKNPSDGSIVEYTHDNLCSKEIRHWFVDKNGFVNQNEKIDFIEDFEGFLEYHSPINISIDKKVYPKLEQFYHHTFHTIKSINPDDVPDPIWIVREYPDESAELYTRVKSNEFKLKLKPGDWFKH